MEKPKRWNNQLTPFLKAFITSQNYCWAYLEPEVETQESWTLVIIPVPCPIWNGVSTGEESLWIGVFALHKKDQHSDPKETL